MPVVLWSLLFDIRFGCHHLYPLLESAYFKQWTSEDCRFGLSQMYDMNISDSCEGGHRGKECKYTNCVMGWYHPPELSMVLDSMAGRLTSWALGLFLVSLHLIPSLNFISSCVLGEMFTWRPSNR